jgi:tRNA pseudouridine13 synthase
LAGIECYCTSFKGTGGSIKQGSKGFKVTELMDDSFSANISSSYGNGHRYPLYLLRKENIDSNHALIEIEKELDIRLRIMGIKDAKATTIQYAGMERATKNPPKELKSRHTHLSLKGFTNKPLGKEFLSGNKFEITIHNPKTTDLSDFITQIDNIGNFYGLQRFGSERLVTHLIGKEIIRRNFGHAVELLLSHTTEYDTQMSKEIRSRLADPSNFQKVLKIMPRGMDIERQVLYTLVAGKDPIAALRSIPISIRRLFVQAYQAFIFNRCLSIAILNGENLLKPKQGDLCFEMEGPATFGKIIKFNPATKPEKKIIPAIRMAGYTFQPGKGRFENITKTIMQQEEVQARDFYIKEMQELSHQGGFRQAPLWCMSFSHRQNPFTVSFNLPKGSYATTLLREMIKPEDPIRAGF